jgi:hypothetical protein
MSIGMDWGEFYNKHVQFTTKYLAIKSLYLQKGLVVRMGELEDALANQEAVIAQVSSTVQGLQGVQDHLNQVQAALDAMTVQDEADKADLQAALDAAHAAAQRVNDDTQSLTNLVQSGAPAAPADGGTPPDAEPAPPDAGAAVPPDPDVMPPPDYPAPPVNDQTVPPDPSVPQDTPPADGGTVDQPPADVPPVDETAPPVDAPPPDAPVDVPPDAGAVSDAPPAAEQMPPVDTGTGDATDLTPPVVTENP